MLHRVLAYFYISFSSFLAAGTMPFNADLGINRGVWEGMSQDTQAQVGRLVSMRKALSAVATLKDMPTSMTVKEAKANGVTVLLAADGKVELGIFNVPAIANSICATIPKGVYLCYAAAIWAVLSLDRPQMLPSRPVCNLLAGFVLEPSQYYYFPERMAVVHELLAALDADQILHRASGVLITGPNGVGKSAEGLLAFLSCLAQGRFAIYISDAKAWVAAAEAGHGDEFLLELFVRQNADKVAATPALRAVFDARLRGVPMDAAMMGAFRDALNTHPGLAVAVIVDEVQNITQVIAKAASQPSPERIRAADYFSNGWSTWNTANCCFVRMDIASSHGTRELKLPSGDEGRLRFVRPWPLKSAAAALACKASPAFVAQARTHSRILHIAGGVIRQILRCKSLLRDGPATDEVLDSMEHNMREAMKVDCGHWLRTQLDDAGRRQVARSIVPLIRGQVTWALVKGAYDEGLVALAGNTKHVTPVSPVAASVLHQQLASVLRAHSPSLSSIHGDAERGYELERQMHACLDPCNVSIQTVCLDGEQGPAIHVRVDHALPIHKPMDTAASPTTSVLYIPDRADFDCDAIVVTPAAPTRVPQGPSPQAAATISAPLSAPSSVLVWECSVTDPRDSDRIEKCSKWFNDGGLIPALRATHPSSPITILLCWPGKVDKSRHSKYHTLVAMAKDAGLTLYVVDFQGLQALGVVL